MSHTTSNSSDLDQQTQACGCSEYRALGKLMQPTRRSIITAIGALGTAAAAPSWIPRVAYAASEDSSRDIVVSLFLRGGADGLTLVSPYNEPNLQQLRPTLAVLPPDSSTRAALDLDGQFGLAPALSPLLDAYQAGDLAVIHAVGSKDGTRSHFDAQHFMEVGEADQSLFTGWLGRHIAATAPLDPAAALRALGIGFGLQRTLAGAPLALPVPDLGNFGFEGNATSETLREIALQAMYQDAKQPLAGAADNTFRTVDLLASLDVDNYTGSGDIAYPNGDIGYALKSAAALIRAEEGVEAIAVDYGGWDTHDEQGPFNGGMANNMAALSGAIAAFHADLFSAPTCKVTLVLMSEFGRNAFENASGGTDHGHGNVMFVLSSAANGGQVHTDWPGLDANQLYQEQDLQVTWDYRDILHEILSKRLGNTDPGAVFNDPTYTPVDRGVLT